MTAPRVILTETEISKSEDRTNPEEPGQWCHETHIKNINVNVIKLSDDGKELEVDLIGCSTPFANTLRRILLSEMPSMAIEKVFIINNTTVLQDDVFAHRLGLIPLRANPKLFEYPTSSGNNEEDVSDQDTLKFEMKVSCTLNPHPPKDSRRIDDHFRNNKVYSRDIKWVPIGKQAEIYTNGAEDLGVLEKDILLCKMNPDQEIHCYMHAVKGLAKDHAKFSPLAVASYRLMPDIKIRRPVRGEDAELLKSCFSPGVIEIVENENGETEARVKDPRNDSCSRNIYRYKSIKDTVDIGRISNHFIFTIESLGGQKPNDLLLDSLNILKGKCRYFLDELETVFQQNQNK